MSEISNSGIHLQHFLILSATVFSLGLLTVLIRRNVIVMLMGVELMLNAVNLTLIAFARYHSDMTGNLLVFFVMTIAAAEAGVGLALVVSIYKRFKELNIQHFEQLKG